MPPAGQECLRGCRIGFLDEFADDMGAGNPRQRLTNFNVAIAGFRRRRLHTEGHDPPVLGRGNRHRERRMQRRQILHRMIGRHHPQHCIRIGFGNQQRRRQDRRGGVAPNRLQQDARAGQAGFAQLFGHHKAVFIVGHNDRRREACAMCP